MPTPGAHWRQESQSAPAAPFARAPANVAWFLNPPVYRPTGGAGRRSGKKSFPRASSTTFFAAPINGTALRPVSSVPPTTPFRRIVEKTVATAIALPTHGSERLRRRERRAPPQRTTRFDRVMDEAAASHTPSADADQWSRSRARLVEPGTGLLLS